MGEMQVTLSNGITLGYTQACELARLIGELEGELHWHPNECGCCVTLHGRHGAWVVGPARSSSGCPRSSRACSAWVAGQGETPSSSRSSWRSRS